MLRKLTGLGTAALIGLSLTCGISPATAFGGHDRITRDGLSPAGTPGSATFLNVTAEEDINNEHGWMDEGWPSGRKGLDELHFDDCEFDKSISRINGPWGPFATTGGYVGAVNALKANNVFRVGDDFGKILHAAQDLYSHSNWVELGHPGDKDNTNVNDLVPFSQSLTRDSSWKTPSGGSFVAPDIVLANDDWTPGPGYTVKREQAGPFQSVLYGPDGVRIGRLLETGKGTGDDECDIAWTGYTGFTHDDIKFGGQTVINGLNKDDPGEGHGKARKLAVLQTGYEWCRLVGKAGTVDRDGLLLTMMVRPSGNPHPAKTPCAPVVLSGSAHRVTVTVESVRILRDGEDSGNGEIQLSAALYDDPKFFHRSVHRENLGGRMSLNAGDFVPSSQLPSPMTMCVRPSSLVNWAMNGWDNDDSSSDRYARLYDDWGDDDDELLIGGQTQFSSEVSGTQTLNWRDLSVRIRISQGGRCS